MKKIIFIHISFIDCFPRLGMKREKEKFLKQRQLHWQTLSL